MLDIGVIQFLTVRAFQVKFLCQSHQVQAVFAFKSLLATVRLQMMITAQRDRESIRWFKPNSTVI